MNDLNDTLADSAMQLTTKGDVADSPCSVDLNRARSRYLVFTSAGDHSAVHQWLRGRRNFDLWITYFGNETESPLVRSAEFFNVRKGGKFPNLHYAWRRWREVFAHYEAVFVLDDDIVLNGSQISQLFRVLSRYNLALLQPAFLPIGKVSHTITVARPRYFGRRVDFVEVGTPLFRMDALERFLSDYDPQVVGWGVDCWYMQSIGDLAQDRTAVIDAIPCINPDERLHNRPRAIDALQSTEVRRLIWERVAAERGLRAYGEMKEVGVLVPISLEDRLATLTAPFRSLYLTLFSEHSRRSVQRTYWRLAQRLSSMRG